MRAALVTSSALFAAASAADWSNGFKNPVWTPSVGGKAQCIEGSIPVSISTSVEKVKLNGTFNQFQTTEFFVEFEQIGSNTSTAINGGMQPLTGTYNIYGQLCYPVGKSSSNRSLQFLTHGINFDRSYWNLKAGLSYVDAAAEAGYPTFLYDRLGVGQSDHPDPIQVVQSYTELAIAHSLVSLLRAGSVGPQKFDKIVGVGHSFGSIISTGVAAKYPKDFDAIILQGFSLDQAGIPTTFAAFNPAIAALNSPIRFGFLPSGYLVVDSPIGDQTAFYRAPQFSPDVFAYADSRKQTFTLGEVATLASIVAPAPLFTGPVDVVDGENDYIFCQSNCNLPVDQAAAVQAALFPAANKVTSSSYLVPGTGHGINAHNTAPLAFSQMLNFTKNAGF